MCLLPSGQVPSSSIVSSPALQTFEATVGAQIEILWKKEVGMGRIVAVEHSHLLSIGYDIIVGTVDTPGLLPDAVRVTVGAVPSTHIALGPRDVVGIVARGIAVGLCLATRIASCRGGRRAASVANALNAALVASRGTGRRVSNLHQVRDGRLDLTSFLDSNQLA